MGNDASNSDTALRLRLTLSEGLPRPAGTVALVNESDQDVRVWRGGNEWGDAARQFSVTHDDNVTRVVLAPQVYTRNAPSPVVVEPGETHEWTFVLSDEHWQAPRPLGEVLVSGAQLVAVYEAPPSPEAAASDVWTGKLTSAPVPL